MDTYQYYLSDRLQKYLRWLHVLFAAVMFGGLCSMLIMIILKEKFHQPASLYPIDYAIFKVFDYTISYNFYLLLITAFLYGAFTKWGFLKHYWIIIKWMAVICLYGLVWFGWGESINAMVALTDGEFYINNAETQYGDEMMNATLFTVASGIILVIVFFVSTYKPGGIRHISGRLTRKFSLILAISLFIIFLTLSLIGFITIEYARNIPIEKTELAALKNGTYTGSYKIGGFIYGTKVTITEGNIDEIKILQNRESSYARYAEAIIPRIIAQQSAKVEAISGATTTSKALMKSVSMALQNAKHSR